MQVPRMTMMGATEFERFFRVAASLDVDKQALKRYSDFVSHKIYDLLIRGQATAKANGRDIIEPHDLPITKGLRECIHAFAKLKGEIELKAILDHITTRPPLHLTVGVGNRIPSRRNRGWIERGARPRL
jgi:hypothetical protein